MNVLPEGIGPVSEVMLRALTLLQEYAVTAAPVNVLGLEEQFSTVTCSIYAASDQLPREIPR
jgi:hypothetical protein